MTIKKTIVGDMDAEALRFTVGNDTEVDIVLTEVDCIGSAAHVTMLSKIQQKQKLFTVSEKKKVISELLNIIRQSRAGKFKIRYRDQDVHLAVERIMIRNLGVLGKRVHTARSRNDQIAVDLRLYGKEQLLELLNEILDLGNCLWSFAKRHRTLPMVGRTHMQPAMPSSVGLWASAYTESLLDDLILLKSVYEINDKCPLGSAAGYGVPLEIDRDMTSSLLGFTAPHANVLYASSARGKCESAILSALSQVMLTLSRLSEDLILYSMPELGYFDLPPEYCSGSSIMPQKKNPDVLELVRAKTAKVVGYATTAAMIVKNLPGGYNRDLQETKEVFIAGMETTRASVRILTGLVMKVTANKKALLAGFAPQVFAADRALELVADGMSFRDAYNHVKARLEELNVVDPIKVIADRTALSAPTAVDFVSLSARGREMKKFAQRERRKYNSAISRLLGVKYPSLSRC